MMTNDLPTARVTALGMIRLAWQSVLFALGLFVVIAMIASCWQPSANALAGWITDTLIPFLQSLAEAIVR